MIDLEWKVLIFIKDFTGRGTDRFYWMDGGQLQETSAEEIVCFPGAIVCHDFWIIRDVLFDRTQDLPRNVIDLDEFRISISGNPEDRRFREKVESFA